MYKMGIKMIRELEIQEFFDHTDKLMVSMLRYKGESISDQPNSFPMDQVGHDFHALFQYLLYVGTKLHAYRVILY